MPPREDSEGSIDVASVDRAERASRSSFERPETVRGRVAKVAIDVSLPPRASPRLRARKGRTRC